MNHVITQFFGCPCCMSHPWVKILNLRMLPYRQVWHCLSYVRLWREMQSQCALTEIQNILLMFCIWSWWFCLGSSRGQCRHQSKLNLHRGFVYTVLLNVTSDRSDKKKNMFDLLCKTQTSHTHSPGTYNIDSIRKITRQFPAGKSREWAVPFAPWWKNYESYSKSWIPRW